MSVGYFSGTNTHQIDFRDCEEALFRLMSAHQELQFVLVGMLELGPKWDVFRHRVKRLPFLPYPEMLKRLASVDVNLAPLERGNPYCEGKSELKIFEAGLVGVPTVASAVSSYSEAIDDGIDGFLAQNMDEWYQKVENLIEAPSLRAEMGRKARERALERFGPEATALRAEQVFGLRSAKPTAPAVPAAAGLTPNNGSSSDGPAAHKTALRIAWIVPGLIIGGGGHRNILRAAYHLNRFGHHIELYFRDTDLTEAELQAAVREHFYPINCPMYRYTGSIRKADVIFATHWSTVAAAIQNREAAAELMYFVQDFEPSFYPMGTDYILAENTYRKGLYHITSGPWCENFLRSQFQVPADHFLFPVDTTIYHVRPRTKIAKNVLFFAKPEMPRRCHSLGIMALEEFHRAEPQTEIILFGSREVAAKNLPFPATVRSVLPTTRDLAEMYSNADLGIVFSTTNPSLVPYEMMACGLPVVDLGRPGNEINYGGRSDIARLVDPEPSAMAKQISALLASPAELAERSKKGLDFVKGLPSEEQMARRVEELIIRRLEALGSLALSASGT